LRKVSKTYDMWHKTTRIFVSYVRFLKQKWILL